MSPGAILSQRYFDPNLEMVEIVDVIVDTLRRRAKSITAALLYDRLQAAGQKVAPSSERSFPSRIQAVERRCKTPEDGVERLVMERYCPTGSEAYAEVFIADFSTWQSLTNVTCGDCVTRYLGRTNAFTIDKISAALTAQDYRSVGIVQGQIIELGMPTPLVHTGFISDGKPTIVVGHRPVSAAGGDAQPPAIFELRIYSSARKVD